MFFRTWEEIAYHDNAVGKGERRPILGEVAQISRQKSPSVGFWGVISVAYRRVRKGLVLKHFIAVNNNRDT